MLEDTSRRRTGHRNRRRKGSKVGRNVERRKGREWNVNRWSG